MPPTPQFAPPPALGEMAASDVGVGSLKAEEGGGSLVAPQVDTAIWEALWWLPLPPPPHVAAEAPPPPQAAHALLFACMGAALFVSPPLFGVEFANLRAGAGGRSSGWPSGAVSVILDPVAAAAGAAGAADPAGGRSKESGVPSGVSSVGLFGPPKP